MITRDMLDYTAALLNATYINKESGEQKPVDVLIFRLKHQGIDRLEKYVIDKEDHCCGQVFFDAGTENLDNILFYIWSDYSVESRRITPRLLEEEKQMLIEYALEEIKKKRMMEEEKESESVLEK